MIIFLVFACLAVFPAAAQITEFPIAPQFNFSSSPEGITVGPDGAFWFAELNYDQVGRMDTNGNYSVPIAGVSNTGPFDIVVGPDGNLWFTEAYADKIARISRGTNGTFTNGILTEFPLHPGISTNSFPAGITVGPDGNFWFLEYWANLIGVMNTNGQMLHEYGAGILLTNSELYHITKGSDGNLWFTDVIYGRIGQITTAGAITEFQLPQSNCEPYDIVAGPDGALWFTEINSNRIGHLTTTGVYTNYPLPSYSGISYLNYSQEPYNLTVGKDGNIWFTEYAGANVARITPSGFITEFPTPTQPSAPTGIVAGPDGNIWFGEYYGNSIGRFAYPTLTITISNSLPVLTWPSYATDFVLQGNTNLSSTNWINLTSPPPVIVSNLYVYTNTTPGIEFFRLYALTQP